MSDYMYFRDGDTIKSEPWVPRIPNIRTIDLESC